MLSLMTLIDIILTKGVPVGLEIYNALKSPPVDPTEGTALTWDQVLAAATAAAAKAQEGEDIANAELAKLDEGDGSLVPQEPDPGE